MTEKTPRTQDQRFETLLETICLDDGSMAPEVLAMVPAAVKALTLRVQQAILAQALVLATRTRQQVLGTTGAHVVQDGKQLTDEFRLGWAACAKAMETKLEEALKTGEGL